MRLLKYGAVLLFLMSLWGCGKGNPSAPVTIDPVTGKHSVSNWVSPTVHGGLDFGASKDMAACQECHGNDFTGGISKVSCLNTAGCHGAGVFSPHPKKPWRGGLITHTLVKESNTPICAICHTKGKNLQIPLISNYNTGAPGCFNSTLCHGVVGHANDPQPWSAPANHGANQGPTGRPGAKFSIQACQSCHATPSSGQNPLFTNPKTGMPGGCSSSGCHDQNVNLAHPYVWLPNRVTGITTSHATAQDLSSSCGLCHGTSLNGAASGGVAPSCTTASLTFNGVTIRCHSNTTMATSTSYVQCTSCHGGTPSGPNGASFPNISGAHPKHTAISLVTCSTCHNGAGNGTQLHANGVPNVVFLASQAGASAAYVAATQACTNVTCHGGTTTPAWTAKNQGCTACHTSPPSTNNHLSHWTVFPTPAIKCDACHTGDGPGLGVAHPNGIAVVGFPAKFNDGGAGYAAGACSNISCHGGNLTPAWNTPDNPSYVYDSTGANCTANCHTVRNPPIQYIDVFNGNNNSFGTDMHDMHINYIGAICTDCHGLQADKLPQSHFSGLFNGKRQFIATDPMAAGFAAGTMGGTGTQISSYTYDGVTPGVIPRGSCITVTPGTGGCHNGETRFWFVK